MCIFCWGVDIDGCPESTYDFLRLGLATKVYFHIPTQFSTKSFSSDTWQVAKTPVHSLTKVLYGQFVWNPSFYRFYFSHCV